MHTIKLNIQDNIYSHIMFFLKSLNSKDIEIIDNNKSSEALNINYENWTQKEIENIGKIGLHSKSFLDDKEDYSKW
ncbi:MAG: hypothetical protein U9R39_06520 [Campylobacterota bacterium]|nr:hypothetical protein [Campylobacterota bacterium]